MPGNRNATAGPAGADKSGICRTCNRVLQTLSDLLHKKTRLIKAGF